MWKVTFLILVLLSSAVFAQNPSKMKAEKVIELENPTVEQLEATIDVFYQKNLQNNPTAKGVIVNYGKEREISRKEKIIKDLFSKRNYGFSEFTLINGGFLGEIKTEIWLIPEGAEEPPEILLKPRLFDEFGKISNKLLAEKIDSFCSEVSKTNYIGWVIVSGTPKETAKREKKLKGELRCIQEFPEPRILIIVDENKNESKAAFWIVPPGEKPPTIKEK